jgi:hypothetical protein
VVDLCKEDNCSHQLHKASGKYANVLANDDQSTRFNNSFYIRNVSLNEKVKCSVYGAGHWMTYEKFTLYGVAQFGSQAEAVAHKM